MSSTYYLPIWIVITFKVYLLYVGMTYSHLSYFVLFTRHYLKSHIFFFLKLLKTTFKYLLFFTKIICKWYDYPLPFREPLSHLSYFRCQKKIHIHKDDHYNTQLSRTQTDGLTDPNLRLYIWLAQGMLITLTPRL
jgi:hypothetical protein